MPSAGVGNQGDRPAAGGHQNPGGRGGRADDLPDGKHGVPARLAGQAQHRARAFGNGTQHKHDAFRGVLDRFDHIAAGQHRRPGPGEGRQHDAGRDVRGQVRDTVGGRGVMTEHQDGGGGGRDNPSTGHGCLLCRIINVVHYILNIVHKSTERNFPPVSPAGRPALSNSSAADQDARRRASRTAEPRRRRAGPSQHRRSPRCRGPGVIRRWYRNCRRIAAR